MTATPLNVLVVHSSGRRNGSTSRALAGDLLAALRGALGAVKVIERDLADGMPFVDEAWIGANFTPPEERTAAQSATLGYSDALVEELKAADLIVIGAPVYNFSVPAALKAWIDQISRAKLTFEYTPDGPVGLLEGKTALIAAASGGVPIGSEADFATGYLRHVLGFIGIADVHIVAADQQMIDAEKAAARAQSGLESVVAQVAATFRAAA